MNSQVPAFHLPLKLAIVSSGKSQRQLANETGIDETRLSRLVRGRLEPFPDERRALAQALGCAPASLFPPKALSA